MKRLRLFIASLGVLGLVAAASPVGAQDFEEHPHMLIQRPVVELLPVNGGLAPHLVGYRKCVDLAGNRGVPLHAHHAKLHFGEQGVQLFEKAGHAVIPTAPFPAPFADPLPWTGCADFATFLPLPIPED